VSDAALRSLAREAQRDPSARVAYLRARLRADEKCGECGGLRNRFVQPPLLLTEACPACAGTGLLWLPRVQLAAYLGDEAARAALGCTCVSWERDGVRNHADSCAGHGPRLPLADWARGLARWGRMAAVRAAVAGARVALAHREAGLTTATARRAIEAAEAWIVCPCEEHRRTWEHVAHERNNGWGLVNGPNQWMPCGCEVEGGPLLADTAHLAFCLENAARLAGEDRVRAAVLAEVSPWALQERDAVAERVRERRPLPESCPACGRFGEPPVDEDGYPTDLGGVPCETCGV
jgi:hypothetical protein